MAKLIKGVNDLESQFPDIAKTWDYELNGDILPSQVASHSSRKFYWKCNEGHSYKAIVDNRVNGSGCSYCSGKAVLKGFNDFESQCPDIAKEWDYELNTLEPSEVALHSHKKYHWICSKCGYKWESTAYGRASGNGCPKCANNIAITGYNDLETKRPDLLSEWNYEKNGDISPKKIAVNSHKKVWWKCKLGHEWLSTVENRTCNGNGCPECTSYLGTSFPEQVILFYVSQHYNCENTKIIDRKEIDIYIDSLKIGIEYDGVNWHKDVDKDLEKNRICSEQGIKLLRIREQGCPDITGCECFSIMPNKNSDLKSAILWIFDQLGDFIPDVDIDRDRNIIMSQYETSRGERSLASRFPQLSDEWDYEKNTPLTPEMITYGSTKNVWWKCKLGHEFLASPCNRTKGAKCPYCTNKKVWSGFNDLCTTHPDVAKDWDYEKNKDLDPTKIPHSSLLKVWWKCDKGHEWKAGIASRCSNNSRCRICSNIESRYVADVTTLEAVHPELVSEWDYEKNEQYTPNTIAAYSNKKVWWRCSRGHSYSQTVNSRSYGGGCPYCKMKSVRNIDTGEVFQSITAASKKYQIDASLIIRCAKGKNKTAGGYHWEYFD